MSRRNHHILSVLATLVVALAPWLAEAELRCDAIPDRERVYLRHHVRHNELTPELEQRTIETYLRRADPSRTLLITSELEVQRAALAGVFERVKEGDCSSLTDVQKALLRRQEAAAKFVRATVTQDDYAIDESISLVLDPEERGHPETPEARDALQLKLIHFQMSNYVTAGTPLDEAKTRLIQRYERRLKHLLDVTPEEIYASFLDSFAASLDPHSSYLSAEVLEDFRIQMSLSLEGIGVALAERDGYAVTERIIPGGAADRQGQLEPKDKIIAVAQADADPVDIIDMPLRDSVSLIRGKKGTEVRLTVLRQGETTERFTVTIERDEIDLSEQAASLRFEEREVDGRKFKLAIISLPSFYGDSNPDKRQSTDDVARFLREVNEAGADGLVLDLSRNGGGLLQHAVTISGFFLYEGRVVQIRNTNGHQQVLVDRDDEVLYSGPMVVHTSRVSASASEILAGALKDYKRAVITGDDHTFGKGTVQTVRTLAPGQGALKITTALFFRPGGQSTQNDGVSADVVIPSPLSGDDFGEKTQRYSLEGEKIGAFLSETANAVQPKARWNPVTPGTVAVLAKRSERRVSESEVFREMIRKIEEAREDDGEVALVELRKRREENDDEAESDEAEDSKEKETSPQLDEALSVLVDLVALLG